MKEALREKVEAALRALLAAAGDEGPLPDFAIEVPRQKEHGDFSCNAATSAPARKKVVMPLAFTGVASPFKTV